MIFYVSKLKFIKWNIWLKFGLAFSLVLLMHKSKTFWLGSNNSGKFYFDGEALTGSGFWINLYVDGHNWFCQIFHFFNDYINKAINDVKQKKRKKAAKLPGGVLVTIYSFMTVEELLEKISKLSKSDRKMLLKN